MLQHDYPSRIEIPSPSIIFIFSIFFRSISTPPPRNLDSSRYRSKRNFQNFAGRKGVEGEFYSRPKGNDPSFEAPFELRAIQIYLGGGRKLRGRNRRN